MCANAPFTPGIRGRLLLVLKFFIQENQNVSPFNHNPETHQRWVEVDEHCLSGLLPIMLSSESVERCGAFLQMAQTKLWE